MRPNITIFSGGFQFSLRTREPSIDSSDDLFPRNGHGMFVYGTTVRQVRKKKDHAGKMIFKLIL